MFCASRYSNQKALKIFHLPYTSWEQTYSISILLINTRRHSFINVRELITLNHKVKLTLCGILHADYSYNYIIGIRVKNGTLLCSFCYISAIKYEHRSQLCYQTPECFHWINILIWWCRCAVNRTHEQLALAIKMRRFCFS